MTTIKRWMIQFGQWLIRLAGGRVLVSQADEALLTDARMLVKKQLKWKDRDGEAKRASVYLQLVNAHPTASKRDIALVIEEAVCLDC